MTVPISISRRFRPPAADPAGERTRRSKRRDISNVGIWKVENAYRVLKWQNHLAQMHCRRDDLARQEIWARLAMHNLVSAAVAAAEALYPHADAPDAKHATAPDRHHATVCVCSYLLDPASCGATCVTRSISSRRVPLRQGRPPSKRKKRAIGFAPHQFR